MSDDEKWQCAEDHLVGLMEDGTSIWRCGFDRLMQLMKRLDAGERSEELYEAIMACK